MLATYLIEFQYSHKSKHISLLPPLHPDFVSSWPCMLLWRKIPDYEQQWRESRGPINGSTYPSASWTPQPLLHGSSSLKNISRYDCLSSISFAENLSWLSVQIETCLFYCFKFFCNSSHFFALSIETNKRGLAPTVSDPEARGEYINPSQGVPCVWIRLFCLICQETPGIACSSSGQGAFSDWKLITMWTLIEILVMDNKENKDDEWTHSLYYWDVK